MADGFNVSETKHATKNLTADIIVTSKVLIEPKNKHIAISLSDEFPDSDEFHIITCQSYICS